MERADVHRRIIRASEVGQYAYCSHAWWLGSVEGLPSAHLDAMQAGEAAHRRHGQGVRVSLTFRRLAYTLLFLAVVLLVLTLALS